MSPKGRKEYMKEIVFTQGLGCGEETKGNNVGFLTEKLSAHTNIRTGGCQAGHHFTREDGQEQMFDLYGSGSFSGAETYLRDMVIDPIFLFHEAMELESKGVQNPLDHMFIDQNCLSITPYHGALSRLKELLRGENKKGTTGIGVGEAIRDSADPQLALRVKDFYFRREFLHDQVERIRQYKLKQAEELMASIPTDQKLSDQVYQELKLLNDKDLAENMVDSFCYLKDFVNVVDETYFDNLLNREGNIVCESSHGALLHPWYGFVPHVTQIDPTSQELLQSVKDRQYSGKIIRLGISRTYLTRHGAGPLVSFNQELTQSIPETHNNCHNDWLGEFRNGAYDLVALRYALDLSGGRESFTGLNLSHLDVLSKFSQWPVCESYTLDQPRSILENYFDLDSQGQIIGIKLYRNRQLSDQLEHQTKLTELLNKCQPNFTYLKPTADKKLDQVFIEYVEDKMKLPVVVVAYGPKPSDRHFRYDLA
jgi:adenylosuccinate synthase